MDGWDLIPNGWEFINKSCIDSKNKNNYKSVCNKYNDIKLDVIFVLAGGLNENGSVHEFVKERLDLAKDVYNTMSNQIKIICLGGGTYHKPPILNDKSYVIHESTACSEYLIASGVDPSDIYKEYSSYDTIANAFYAYLNFIKPMRLQNILIITSEFHMKRSQTIFNWIFSFDNTNYNVYYEESLNNGLSTDVLESRKNRETNSTNNLKNNLIPRIKSLIDFHKWFYEEHKAYCSNSELLRINDNINENIKKSY
jgi:vancomycin permeability regulator SanA